MAEYIECPEPVLRPDGKWWIPRLPPHWCQAMGPYDTEEEAWKDANGVERTINTPAWRSMIADIEERENED